MIKTKTVLTLRSYSELKRRVREALAEGRERAADAVERERVRTAWEVGKLILEHILLNKERADYGAQVLKRLTADLENSHTELKYMVEFARANPIGPHAGQLSWAEHRDLLSVNDDDKRESLAREAERQKWPRDILRREIKKLKDENPSAVNEPQADELLVPIKGVLDTYRILIAKAGEWKGRPVIDLGFSNYLDHPALGSGHFKEGDIVEAQTAGLLAKTNHTEADLFTYRAYVFEITDGDTLWVLVHLGFGVITQQHVRLRGLDAPEIATRDGQAAKRFVEQELLSSTLAPIVITSTKSDKYDRYLVDIFYSTKTGETFLNNKLLQAGFAVRV